MGPSELFLWFLVSAFALPGKAIEAAQARKTVPGMVRGLSEVCLGIFEDLSLSSYPLQGTKAPPGMFYLFQSCPCHAQLPASFHASCQCPWPWLICTALRLE